MIVDSVIMVSAWLGKMNPFETVYPVRISTDHSLVIAFKCSVVLKSLHPQEAPILLLLL